VKFLLKSFLSFILCAVALLHISALSHGSQYASVNHTEQDELCFVADEESGLHDLHLHTATDPHRQSKAARIYQRYHERLMAYCQALPASGDTGFTDLLPANEKNISNAVFNSTCLSSCYDYIFRLYPF
jgi:hypothetical protein